MCLSLPTGQFIQCGHALVLGAFEATVEVGKKALNGEEFSASLWQQTFKKTSEDAATAVAPLGGYVLKTHVL